jgi:hypothetical protein
MISLFGIVALFTLSHIVPAAISDRSPHFTNSSATQKLGGVSSLDARCSRIGVDLLGKGGNAADAVGRDLALLYTALTFTTDGRDSVLLGSRW